MYNVKKEKQTNTTPTIKSRFYRTGSFGLKTKLKLLNKPAKRNNPK